MNCFLHWLIAVSALAVADEYYLTAPVAVEIIVASSAAVGYTAVAVGSVVADCLAV